MTALLFVLMPLSYGIYFYPFFALHDSSTTRFFSKYPEHIRKLEKKFQFEQLIIHRRYESLVKVATTSTYEKGGNSYNEKQKFPRNDQSIPLL